MATTSRFPVLPPIKGSRGRRAEAQTPAAEEEEEEAATVMVPKTPLRRKRSRVQREHLRMMLWVHESHLGTSATVIESLDNAEGLWGSLRGDSSLTGSLQGVTGDGGLQTEQRDGSRTQQLARTTVPTFCMCDNLRTLFKCKYCTVKRGLFASLPSQMLSEEQRREVI